MAKSFLGQKRLRKYYGKIREVLEMPNLIEVQKNRVHTLRELAEKSTLFYNDRYEYDNKVAMKYLIF